jgi:hypothetical protein
MPFGSSKPSEQLRPGAGPPRGIRVGGQARTETVITDKNTGDERRIIEERVFGPKAVGEAYGMVGAERSTGMSIAFQTVTTRCWIQMPCEPNTKDAASVADFCWSFVEDQLARQAVESKGILETLAAAKEKYEGKRK